MSDTLFSQATSLAALTKAWEKVNGNGGGPGGDGVTLDRYASQLDARIASLHWSLMNALYRAGPLRRVDIPKKSGGTRTLAIPCVADRIAQTAVAQILTPIFEEEFEDSSYAYRTGKSVQQAVARVAALRTGGYPWVVDADIRAYFDHVPHAPLMARLAELLDDPRLIALIGQWLGDFGDGMGLAQGSPLSPLLANLWLDGLDEAFADGPVRIVRFADDFVLLSRTHKSAEAALHRAQGWLADHGLELNADKSRIVRFEDAFDFLGHLFVRSIVLEREGDATPRLSHRSLTRQPIDPAVVEEDALAASVLISPQEETAPPPPDDPLTALGADQSVADVALGLAPLYVLEADRRIATANECFTVHQGEAELLRIPAHLIGRIDVGPQVKAEAEAIRLAADHDIPLAFVNGLGAAQAVLMPALSDHAGLHLAQARLMLDEGAALAQVRALVAGKLRNSHALLKRLNRRRKLPEVAAACDAIKRTRRGASFANSVDQARGYEGEGAKLYWAALGNCLEYGHKLPRRRDDPRNPVAAVLNFTASLLTRDVLAAVIRAGLHPGFGVLHSGADYRDACAWDLVEAFRAPLSEGLAVYLFNNRILGAADFIDGDGVVRLTGGGSRKLVEGYESWMARPVINPRLGHTTVWRNLILSETRGYAAALRAGAVYDPYELDF